MFQSLSLSGIPILGILSLLILSALVLAQPVHSENLPVDSLAQADQLAVQAQEFEGQEDFQRAVEIYEKLIQIELSSANPRSKILAGNLVRAGYCHIQLGNVTKAEESLNEALSSSQQVNDIELQITAYNNLGITFELQNKFAQSIQHYKEAILLYKTLGSNSGMATNIYRIGRSYLFWERYPEARKYLTEAEKRLDIISKDLTGQQLNDIVAFQESCYQLLTECNMSMNNVPNAFLANETGISKISDFRYGSVGKTIPIVPLDQFQREMSDQSAVLIFANSNSKNPVALAITRDKVRGRELRTKDFINRIQNRYSKELEVFRSRDSRLKWFDNPVQREIKLFGDPAFGEILSFYVSMLSTELGSNSDVIPFIGHELFDLLIGPVFNDIRDKQELTIIPDGLLSGIPFETLTDQTEHYLVGNYQIAYAPSVGMIKLVGKRDYTADRKQVLAIGNPVYKQSKSSGDIVTNYLQLNSLLEDFYSTPAQADSATRLYAAIGAGSWSVLPGSEREIDGIKKSISKTDVLFTDKASEKLLKEMSLNGELSNYQVIHFATHGFTVPAQLSLSALVLSQVGSDQNGSDGFLSLPEMANLKLRSDFINLTHIDPGLDGMRNNSGVNDLILAFTIAGAKGVSISLWQGDPDFVNKYVSHLYGLVVNQGYNFARANTETKRYFISGIAGDTFKSPYFWASNVFHGEQTGITFLTPPKIAILMSQGKQISPATTRQPSWQIEPLVEKPIVVEKIPEPEPEAVIEEPVVEEVIPVEPPAPEVIEPEVVVDEPVVEEVIPEEPPAPEIAEPEVVVVEPVVEEIITEEPVAPEVIEPEVIVKEPVVEEIIPEEPVTPEVIEPVVAIKEPERIKEVAVVPQGGTFKERYQKGVDLCRERKPEQALSIFQKMLAEDDSNDLSDNCQYWIGECYFALGDYQRALAEFELVFDFKNSNKNSYAETMMKKCQSKIAPAPSTPIPAPTPVKASPLSTPTPTASPIKASHAPVEDKILTDDKALQEITSAAVEDAVPDLPATIGDYSYGARYEAGRALYNDQQYTAAITHFRRMVADDKSHNLSDNCQFWIGESYFKMKQYDQALVEFERVLEFENPNKSDDALALIEQCRQKLKEEGSEKGTGKTAIEPDSFKSEPQMPVKPDLEEKTTPQSEDYQTRYDRAIILIRAREHQKALPILKQLLAEDRKHNLADNCQYWIGEVHYVARDYKQAREEFQRVKDDFQNTNKSEDATYMIAKCYEKMNEPEKAKETYQQFVDQFPNSSRIDKVKALLGE